MNGKKEVNWGKASVIIAIIALVAGLIGFTLKDFVGNPPVSPDGTPPMAGVSEQTTTPTDDVVPASTYEPSFETMPNQTPYFKEIKIGQIIPFGGYDWVVLDVQNGKALLLSDTIITRRAYHSQKVGITWEHCDLRKYLNDEFYNSFDVSDRAQITNTKVINDGNIWASEGVLVIKEDGTEYRGEYKGKADGSNDTTDKIFLLSTEEVVQYFGNSGDFESRIVREPGHALNDQYNNNRIAYDVAGTAAAWWLRSPGYPDDNAAVVCHDGRLDVLGYDIDWFSVGVRPALWLNMEL